MRYSFPYFGADLRLTIPQPDTSQHCETTDTDYCIRWCACLLPSFRWALIAPTYGEIAQAELIWVPGSAPNWFTRPEMVIHDPARHNRTWRRVTMLLETNALPLTQTEILNPQTESA